MLTIKRKIPAQQPSIDFLADLIQRGKENGLSSERISQHIFLEFNKSPTYETIILQVGQQVKIVGGMKYETPKSGTICTVIRIEYLEDDEVTEEGIVVAVKAQGLDDYNEFRVKAEPQDVSNYIQLV